MKTEVLRLKNTPEGAPKLHFGGKARFALLYYLAVGSPVKTYGFKLISVKAAQRLQMIKIFPLYPDFTVGSLLASILAD